VNVDNKNRVWFATPDNAGYYFEDPSQKKLIQIELVTPAPSLIPVITVNVTPIKPNLSATTAVSTSSDSSSILTIFAQIIDPITRAISAIAQKYGVNIFS
jgi:hypothetical protein